MEKRIIGAVGVGNQTFTAGQEAEMEAAVEAAQKAGTANVDWDKLEAKGIVVGYGKAKKAAEGDAESVTDTEAPRAAKKAARKRR